LARWKLEIIAWHNAHFSNRPTEAMNHLIKRVKRVAFGFTSFRNYRIRSLLYAGKPNCSRRSHPAEIRSAVKVLCISKVPSVWVTALSRNNSLPCTEGIFVH